MFGSFFVDPGFCKHFHSYLKNHKSSQCFCFWLASIVIFFIDCLKNGVFGLK